MQLSNLRLSTQRALWGDVWPNLRAVFVEEYSYFYSLCFYHHGEINDSAQSHISGIIAEVVSDFDRDNDDNEYCQSSCVIRIDDPNPVPLIGCCVYHRYEQIALSPSLNHAYLQKCLKEDPAGLYLESDLAMIFNTALLGRIRPNLRHTSCEILDDRAFLRFYFDGPMESDDERLAHEAISDVTRVVKSWGPSQRLVLLPKIVRLDYPTKRPFLGRTVYARYEPDPKTVLEGGQNDTLNS